MLILVGFSEEEMNKIDGDKYAVSKEYVDWVLEELIEKKPKGEKYEPVERGKFVIMHNVPNEKISETMRSVRNAVEGRVIFATTTPTSLKWKISDLMEELLEEDEYFRKR